MKLITCVDNSGGVSFFGKRLSKDKKVEDDIKEMTRGSMVYAHPYSQSFFKEPSPNIHFLADYKDRALDNDYVFYEIGQIDPLKFDTLILYCWNRDYPQETLFTPDRSFTLVKEESFTGNSHDKITKRIFKRK